MDPAFMNAEGPSMKDSAAGEKKRNEHLPVDRDEPSALPHDGDDNRIGPGTWMH